MPIISAANIVAGVLVGEGERTMPFKIELNHVTLEEQTLIRMM